MILHLILYAVPFIALMLFIRWRLNVSRRRADQCCHRERLEQAAQRNAEVHALVDSKLKTCVRRERLAH